MKITSLRPRALAFSALAAVFVVGVASAPIASAETWNGTTNAAWNTATNWSTNTKPGVSGTAIFDNAGNGNTVLDLGVGNHILNLTFDTSSVAAYTIGSGAVGSQTLNMWYGGKIELTAAAGADQKVNANLLMLSTINFRNNSVKTLTLDGAVIGDNNTNGKIVTFDGTGDVVVNGAFSNGGTGAVSLELKGIGKTTLANVNSFTGATNIGSGELILSGTRSGGGPINVRASGGGYAGTGTLVQTATGVIGGASALSFAAAGSTNILAGNNSYTGSTAVTAGILQVTHSNGLGSTTGGSIVSLGAELQLSGGITIGAEALSLGGTGFSNTGALRNVSGNNTYGGDISLSVNTVRACHEL